MLISLLPNELLSCSSTSQVRRALTYSMERARFILSVALPTAKHAKHSKLTQMFFKTPDDLIILACDMLDT